MRLGDNTMIFNDIQWITEVLDASNTGLWLITIDPVKNVYKMFGNSTLFRLLGLADANELDPAHCYQHWFSRIDKNHVYRVQDTVAKILQTKQQGEVQYPWQHPQLGTIFVRCGGKCIASTDGLYHLCGYHQNVTEMELVQKKLEESLKKLSEAQHMTNQLAILKEHYHHLAYIDMLTGLPNRRAFFEFTEGLLKRLLIDEQSWIVMADIDFFKSVNDTHGHLFGDEVLKEFAHRFKENLLEDNEFISRVGGEEFAMLLWGYSESAVIKRIEAFRKIFSDTPFSLTNGCNLCLTCSFGIASIHNLPKKNAHTSIDHFLHHADMALYQAKNTGRNKTVLFDTTANPPDLEWQTRRTSR